MGSSSLAPQCHSLLACAYTCVCDGGVRVFVCGVRTRVCGVCVRVYGVRVCMCVGGACKMK